MKQRAVVLVISPFLAAIVLARSSLTYSKPCKPLRSSETAWAHQINTFLILSASPRDTFDCPIRMSQTKRTRIRRRVGLECMGREWMPRCVAASLILR